MPDEKVPKVTIDDIVESAAHGVLRALDARRVGTSTTAELVRSGFNVDILIRCGGILLGNRLQLPSEGG